MISLSAVSEAPMSRELGLRRLWGHFRYSDLKEAAPEGDYGICIWMSRS
jgi:hypothetical protein